MVAKMLFFFGQEQRIYRRKVFDRDTGDYVTLSDEQVELLTAIGSSRFMPSHDPYEPFYEIYSSQTEIHPMSNRPESKRSFLPSRDEERRVGSLICVFCKSDC